MARYSLNLPAQLKKDAEDWAEKQGLSLNQFILWAVAEKVGALNQQLDDPAFPHITYRRGASGTPAPVIRGTGIRVQTIVIAVNEWGLTPEQVAAEYDLRTSHVEEALSFYDAHREEIDTAVALEQTLEAGANG